MNAWVDFGGENYADAVAVVGDDVIAPAGPCNRASAGGSPGRGSR